MMTVLHLDDDSLFLHRCSISFNSSPHAAHLKYEYVDNSAEFEKKLSALKPHCVLLDLSFGGGELKGLEVLKQIRKSGYHGQVVVMSALSSSDVILSCISDGANDFLSKSIDESELTYRVARLCQQSRAGMESSIQLRGLPMHISGRSMRDVQKRLIRVTQSHIGSVLVTGESGTGKEMVADTLQAILPVGAPFVSLNCAALSSQLIEAEIFGYQKGAFTGATQNKIGLYEAADGGWIFLDEVARLSLPAQAALLRALENGEVRAVGSNHAKKVKVKVIAATNEPLDSLVEQGAFRGDLLSRLRGYEITLPPYRVRSRHEREEILESLLDRLNASVSVDGQEFRITHSCASVLIDLPWNQGNVRELWQTLQAMAVDATDGVISLELLPKRLLTSINEKSTKNISHQPPNGTQLVSLSDVIETAIGFPVNFENLVDDLFEKLLEKLREASGERNPSQRTIAQMLQISRHEAGRRLARSGKTVTEGADKA
ncbi:MAG: hypothetical protein RJB13_266 [Pseudomonadota bacterium]